MTYLLHEDGRIFHKASGSAVAATARVVSDHIDVPHLSPFTFGAEITLPGNVKRLVRTRVAFTCHCWTEAHDADRDAGNLLPIIMDHKAERIISPERLALSRELPGLVRGLMGHKVYMTPSKRNYMAYDGRVVLPDGRQYRIFFKLTKKPSASHDVELYVESAYPTDDPIIGMELRFKALLAAVWQGKKIKYNP